MSALSTLAKMLGVSNHQAEDALYSERCARVALSRRGLFAAGAALAGGAVFAGDVYAPPPAFVYVNPWTLFHLAGAISVYRTSRLLVRAKGVVEVISGSVP